MDKLSWSIVLILFMLPLDYAESRKIKLKRHKSLLTVEAVIFKACPCTILISTNSTKSINMQKTNYEVNNIKNGGLSINLYNSYGNQKSFTQGCVVTSFY